MDHDIESWELDYSAAKDWISVSLPVERVERLLDTKYSVFEHVDGTRLVRAPEYSLPMHLHDHVSIVTPTNSFLKGKSHSSNVKVVEGSHPNKFPPLPAEPSLATVDSVCNFSLVTPACLRTIYGTINYTAQVPGKNMVGLNDFLGEVNNRSDVSLFLKQFRPEAAAAAYQFKQISIAGGTLQQTPDNVTELQAETGIEGNLDAETILGRLRLHEAPHAQVEN